jgi:NitT/TauT family transport system ATP-binding protein
MRIRAGFIPLVDAAALVAAADRGFASEEGITLDLVREVSWSNMRDRLNFGHFDAAHLLAPMVIAGTLGIDSPPVPLSAAIVLGQNGNSIVLAEDVHAALQAHAGGGDLADPAVSGAALKRLLATRRAAGGEPLHFGMTFPFSNHNYLLRYWMAAAGVDPDEDVRLVVTPPPYMVDGLRSGRLHGFCAGSPWPALAVEEGAGRILHLGTDIIAVLPEKVLALRTDWAAQNPEATTALTRALIRAATWCSMPQNRVDLAQMLAAPGRLDVPAEIILRALEGRLRVDGSGRLRENARYLTIGPPASRPDPDGALWMYAQMARWKQLALSGRDEETVRGCFSPRLHDAAVASMSGADAGDGVGAFIGPRFDPNDLGGYLAELTAQSAVMHKS